MNKNLIVFALMLPLLGACGKQAGEPDDSKKPIALTDSLRKVITIDTVHEVPLNNELILNGRVTFNPEKVAHVYPMFGGNVISINTEIGDYVKKGDVLAVIRSGEIAGFEKEQKEADQQLRLATRNLEATRDMFHSGMSSERDVLQAEQEKANAEAEQKRIREIYSIYNISDQSNYSITSPVSGFVIDKHVNREMQLRSDQSEELFTISGLDDVWIMADVYESDISKVKEGAPVRITTLAYNDKDFTGEIDKVYNMLDNDSKTMKVRVKLKNENYMLKPGMFTNVYVTCQVSGEVKLRIPAKAIIFENGKQYVVCVTDKGYLEMQEVSVFKQDERFCYLNIGLKEGQFIVNKNALLVYNALK